MTYTNLELASMGKVPLADELLGSWEIVPNPHSTSQAERSAALVDLGFGKRFSDHMAHATWTAERGWHDFRIEPYEAIAMSPAGAVLHYGQEVFEGLKAYRHADGSIWTFRPTYNHSSRRLAIPEFEHEAFIGSIVNLVRQDAAWVPDAPGSSLYLRPFIFASEAFLGVRASHRYEYMVVASPSGAYFANGFQPIDVWVEREFHRAGTGGMGDAKTGGNYASSLLPKTVAHDAGYDEVMFLDATMGTDIDELGGMNVFVVMSDPRGMHPFLHPSALAGRRTRRQGGDSAHCGRSSGNRQRCGDRDVRMRDCRRRHIHRVAFESGFPRRSSGTRNDQSDIRPLDGYSARNG